jgi:competence protein ComEC
MMIGRKVPQNKILIYSGLILLWFNPFLIFSISFQLSYLATFALINSFSIPLFTNKKDLKFDQIENSNTPMIGEEKLFEWSNSTSGYVIANLSIFLYTLPIIVMLNGYVSVWSILINMILIPIIPLISLLNIFALIPFVGSFINIFPLIMELSQFNPTEISIYYLILLISNTLLKYYFEYAYKYKK